MSQSRTEAGQSMEEILASIRRIIAEGERDAQEAGGQHDRIEPASTSPTAETPEEPTQAEVLVLTEMVQDDGSVVSLQSAAPSAPAAPDDASVDSLLRRSLLADAEPGPAASVSVAAAIETVEVAIRPPAAPPPPEAPVPAPAVTIETGAKPKPADALSDKLPAWLSPTTPPTREPTREERIPVSSEGMKRPELVSEEALAASTAALAQLAQSVTRTREPAPGASKTLEEVVREAVEPLLKQWLDQHLPRIVERMVREAIDRVVRRVE
jgi:cell pole-organizing protein PopZ